MQEKKKNIKYKRRFINSVIIMTNSLSSLTVILYKVCTKVDGKIVNQALNTWQPKIVS